MQRWTKLTTWNARGRGEGEGLLLGPLRAPPARGSPLPDEEVLDAPREGRAERYLRIGRASRPPCGHGRGDTASPRSRLPRKGRRWDTDRQGDAQDRLPLVAKD